MIRIFALTILALSFVPPAVADDPVVVAGSMTAAPLADAVLVDSGALSAPGDAGWTACMYDLQVNISATVASTFKINFVDDKGAVQKTVYRSVAASGSVDWSPGSISITSGWKVQVLTNSILSGNAQAPIIYQLRGCT